MSKCLQNKPVISIIAACVVICSMLTRPAGAQFGGAGGVLAPTRIQQGDYGRGRSQNRQPVGRRDQAGQAIDIAAREMDQMLVQVLEMVNQQARPRPEMVDASKRAVIAARKYGPRYSAALKCEILMLQAWNGYFADDMPTAVMAASKAYKTNSTNRDAEATNATMALLMDRKPKKIEPRKPRTTSSNYSRGGRNNPQVDAYARTQNTRGAGQNGRASSGNILDLDVDAIDLDLIGQTVPAMQVNCLNSTTFNYDPAQSNLCILFWQLGSKDASGEPNDMTTGRPRSMRGRSASRSTPARRGGGRGVYDERGYDGGRNPYEERGSGGGRGAYEERGYGGGRGAYDERGYGGGPGAYDGYGAGSRQPNAGRAARNVDPFASGMTAYGQLFGSYLGHPKVKFLAVNVDPLRSAPTVVNKLLESPWPWAHVMAAQPGSGMAQYADINSKQPMLAIVDTSGKIKYAGPAAGFLPSMMLKRLAGAPASSGSLRPPVGTTPPRPRTIFNPFKGLLGGQSNKPKPDQPAQPVPVNPQPNRTNEDDSEITPESYQAGKLLEYAKMFVSAGRKPVLTSKKGVDICRQIIREYPNTKYEQEARMLLRRVPEYERKRYNITDKEMGL